MFAAQRLSKPILERALSGKLQQHDLQGHVHAGFDAQLTIAHASLAVAGAAAARSSYMDELSHQTSADTPGALHIGEQLVSTCSFAP